MTSVKLIKILICNSGVIKVIIFIQISIKSLIKSNCIFYKYTLYLITSNIQHFPDYQNVGFFSNLTHYFGSDAAVNIQSRLLKNIASKFSGEEI